MAYILGVLGAVAAMAYHMLFDPARHPAHAPWAIWDFEVLAIYGAIGFAIGWVAGVIVRTIGHD